LRVKSAKIAARMVPTMMVTALAPGKGLVFWVLYVHCCGRH
jgi:hypothetical protein